MRSVAHLSPQLFRCIFMDYVLQDSYPLFTSFLNTQNLISRDTFIQYAPPWILWQVLAFVPLLLVFGFFLSVRFP
jgi:hypothetical protein